jgi:regulatory protein
MGKSVKAAAMRFLKIRPRSIEELKEKLGLKGFSSTEIEAVVLDLMASGLLDDRAFTKSWINYRLARPFGFRRIIQELKAKGIDQETIEQAVAEVKDSYNPEDVALELARRRWQRLPDIDTQKKKKRILDFLLRRGFELELILRVLRRVARN